jgi:hypothetical protein
VLPLGKRESEESDMKALLSASLILSIALVSRATDTIGATKSKPAEAEIVNVLNEYYAGNGNTKYEFCIRELNYPPKPLSSHGLYKVTLTAAAYAEDIISDCK